MLSRFIRAQSGSQLVEFAAALALFVCLVIIPLADMAILSMRAMSAQKVVNNYARKLALCETFSQSVEMLEAEPSFKSNIEKIGGLSVESIDLRLKISRIIGDSPISDSIVVNSVGSIPPQWLPDGDNAPCSYVLELQVKCLISPALLVRGTKYTIPGITTPVPMMIGSDHEWENLGRDSHTKEFYINK